MRVTATSEVIRIMGVWVRRADAGMAPSADRNVTDPAHGTGTGTAQSARTRPLPRGLRHSPDAAA